VRLKAPINSFLRFFTFISIPTGAIKRSKIYDWSISDSVFQFLLVRLKVIPKYIYQTRSNISIPTGAIKSLFMK